MFQKEQPPPPQCRSLGSQCKRPPLVPPPTPAPPHPPGCSISAQHTCWQGLGCKRCLLFLPLAVSNVLS